MGFTAGPDAHRQRLDQRAGIVGDPFGQCEGEVLVDGHVVAEGTVDRRGGEEADLGAEVVAAGAALAAGATGYAGLQRDPLADLVPGRTRSLLDDHAARLVAEDQRFPDHVSADATMLVVVDVGATDADGVHFHQHLCWARLGDGHVVNAQVVNAVQGGCSILHRAAPSLPGLARTVTVSGCRSPGSPGS